MRLILVARGSGAGSNNVVVNPGTGGVIQRRARPRPNDCILPAAASESRARWTVRWLAPSASANAELDQDSPSARKASTAACSSSTGRASTTTSRARCGTSSKPLLRRTHVSQRAKHPAKPADFDPQPRAMRFIGDASRRNARARSVSRDTSPGQASPSARASANNTGRVQARPPCWRHARRDGTHPRQAPSTRAALRPPRASRGRSSPCAMRRAAGVFEKQDALSTSAVSAGIPAWRAARSARASAARAVFVRRRRIAIPATTSSWAARNAGGKRGGVELCKRTLGRVEAPDQEEPPESRDSAHARRSPCRRVLRASSVLRRAPSRASPDRARRARSRPRRRHSARGQGPLSDRRRAPHCAREPSRERNRRAAPSQCREGPSAGASLRKATRFSAPSGSPAASARAAAVISESIQIPPHLSLSPFDAPAPNLSHRQHPHASGSSDVHGSRDDMEKNMKIEMGPSHSSQSASLAWP